MPLANAQNDAMLTSDPLSDAAPQYAIPFDTNWSPIVQRIWARHARNGSEVFWRLFAASVEYDSNPGHYARVSNAHWNDWDIG